MFKLDRPLLWFTALLILLLAGYLLWADTHPQYERYQEEFRTLVEERFGPERAAGAPRGLQQIWLRSAGRVDRCTSCHVGVTWADLEAAEQPFAAHAEAPLRHHPIEEFGCTLCHGGQGAATELPDAHGWVPHWPDPLLDSQLAGEYGLDSPSLLVQSKCNVCHRYDREIDGAPELNAAKDLVRTKGCRACHIINGRGGSIGPDLTSVGDKSPELYDYSRLTEIPSLLSWHVGHLQNPKSFAEGSIMPDFGFNRRQALALTMLLLSWSDADLPAELLPGAVLRDEPTPEELERERIMREGEGRFFVEKTCFICHDVSSLGIESATKIGPDLAVAVEDAPRRFGRTLDDFMMNPSGTMSVVLSTQIELTEEERREAVRLLKIAYEKHQEQRAAEAEEGGG